MSDLVHCAACRGYHGPGEHFVFRGPNGSPRPRTDYSPDHNLKFKMPIPRCLHGEPWNSCVDCTPAGDAQKP